MGEWQYPFPVYFLHYNPLPAGDFTIEIGVYRCSSVASNDGFRINSRAGNRSRPTPCERRANTCGATVQSVRIGSRPTPCERRANTCGVDCPVCANRIPACAMRKTGKHLWRGLSSLRESGYRYVSRRLDSPRHVCFSSITTTPASRSACSRTASQDPSSNTTTNRPYRPSSSHRHPGCEPSR